MGYTHSGSSGVSGIVAIAGHGVYGKITNSSGTATSLYAAVESTGSGTSNGVYINDTAGGTGTTYGIFSDVSEATTTGDAYAGYFHGPVTIDGQLTITGGHDCTGCSSDRRLKKNIEPMAGTSALDQLLKLKGVTFEWKEPKDHQNHTGTQMGVIAQDVETVFPQWVREDHTGFKVVDPDARTMVGLTVEGFRELKAENDELRAHVAKLEASQARVAKLEDELDSLKAGRNPMTGDRGMLWLIAMTFAVGGGVIVTRKQHNEKRP